MMLGGPMPVRLPYSADESMLVTRRQSKLSRDIDIINQKIRNNVLSRSEGAMRIRFKQSEIDELQRYKASKRVPTGRLSPAPRRQKVVPRKGWKPANKYNPYATDKVNRATNPNMFDGGEMTFNRASPEKRHQAYQQSTSWTEDDRAGFTSQGNDRADGKKPPQDKPDGTNARGLVEADYYSRFYSNFKARNGKAPNSFMKGVMKKSAVSRWQSNAPLPAKVNKTAESVADKAKGFFKKFRSSKKNDDPSIEKIEKVAINEMNYDPSIEEALNVQTTQVGPTSSTKKVVDQSKNPYAKAYGSTFGKSDRSKTGGSYVIYNGQFYGPKSSFPFTVVKFFEWNKQKGVTVKRATKTIRVSDFAGFGGMPNHLIRNRSRALRDTALMRKRAGARINFDNPNMTNNTQMRSWETYAKPEDVAMVKTMIPEMTGLEKFPELTPAGNAMMVELASHNNDPMKLQMAANKLATDLMNKSGYFVKQYSVKVDPLQMKVKISEMSGLAGGLSKTRNSMQRLLK